MGQPLTWKPIPMPSNATASRMASAANRSLFQAGSLLSSGFADLTAANKVAKEQAKNPQLDFATEQITALNRSDQFTEENRKALLSQLTNQDARREANTVWEKEKASTLAEERDTTKFQQIGEKHKSELETAVAERTLKERQGRASLMSAGAAQQNAATQAADLQWRKDKYQEGLDNQIAVANLANQANDLVKGGQSLTEATNWLETAIQGLNVDDQKAALSHFTSLVTPDSAQKIKLAGQQAELASGAASTAAPIQAKIKQEQERVTKLGSATDDDLAKAAQEIQKGEDRWWRNENEELISDVTKAIPKAVATSQGAIRQYLNQALTPEVMKSLGNEVTADTYEKAKGDFIDRFIYDAGTIGHIKESLKFQIMGADEADMEPLADAAEVGKTLAPQLLQNAVSDVAILKLTSQLTNLKTMNEELGRFADSTNQRIVASGGTPWSSSKIMKEFLKENPQYAKK